MEPVLSNSKQRKPRHWLIAEPGQPPREVLSAEHPCDRPAPDIEPSETNRALYAGPREHVVDVERAPENPKLLRHRGVMSDPVYDRLKAKGLVSIEAGLVIVHDAKASVRQPATR